MDENNTEGKVCSASGLHWCAGLYMKWKTLQFARCAEPDNIVRNLREEG